MFEQTVVAIAHSFEESSSRRQFYGIGGNTGITTTEGTAMTTTKKTQTAAPLAHRVPDEVSAVIQEYSAWLQEQCGVTIDPLSVYLGSQLRSTWQKSPERQDELKAEAKARAKREADKAARKAEREAKAAEPKAEKPAPKFEPKRAPRRPTKAAPVAEAVQA